MEFRGADELRGDEERRHQVLLFARKNSLLIVGLVLWRRDGLKRTQLFLGWRLRSVDDIQHDLGNWERDTDNTEPENKHVALYPTVSDPERLLTHAARHIAIGIDAADLVRITWAMVPNGDACSKQLVAAVTHPRVRPTLPLV